MSFHQSISAACGKPARPETTVSTNTTNVRWEMVIDSLLFLLARPASDA